MRRFVFALLIPLAACQGHSGADGDNGRAGANGTDGNDGTNGTDGSDGTNGTDGTDEFPAHSGEAPWGVHVDIASFSGGSGADGAFQVGDTPVLSFTMTDDEGVAYDIADIHGVEVVFSGPSDHPQLVSFYDVEQYVVPSVATWDSSAGAWSFTFPDAISATYLAPHNDTEAFGEDDGDWGGLPLVDGTYTVAVSAIRFRQLDDGSVNYESDSATSEVLLGAATEIASREVVLEENCKSCHGDDFYGHAGVRRELAYCLSCHVAGSEDRYSSEDSSTTPGVTVAFAPLIHGIHMGKDRPEALSVNGYPANPYGDGYPNYNETNLNGFYTFSGNQTAQNGAPFTILNPEVRIA